MRKRDTAYQVFSHVILGLLLLIMLVPFVLLFMSSITEESSLIRNGYSLFPEAFSLDAYRYILVNSEKIFRAYGITVFITVVGTCVNLLITAMLAYPLSLKRLPGRQVLMFLIFLTILFSGGLVPTYVMYTQLFHIKNTIFALLVPGLLMSSVNVLLMRSFFLNNIPDALFEAAEVDGAGHMYVFTHVVLPLGKPILVTVGLFAGLGYWNDWTNGLYYVSNQKLWGIQSLLNQMISNIQYLQSGNQSATAALSMGQIPGTSVRMAIAFVAVLPVLVVYPFLQKYFARGIALGAVKG